MDKLNPLLIGALRVPRTDFLVEPIAHTSKAYEGRPVIGSLAMDILWPYDIELDLANKKLTLYSPGHCSKQPVHWANTFGRIPVDFNAVGNVFLTVELDGKRFETGIATSQEGTTLGVDASRLLPTFNGHSDSIPVPMEIKSGDLIMPDVRIKLTPTPRSCTLSNIGRPDGAFGYDGCYGRYSLVLGRSELERLHLYFATKEKVIYFTEIVRK